MGYLRLYDYQPTIQTSYFNQLVQGNDANRILQEQTALAEMKSYLVQKFDVSTEFADTTIFNYSNTYFANALVELNFTAYSATSTYALNSLVTYNGNEYYCVSAIAVAEPFNPAHWQLIGAQYDLYYLAYPYPVFNVNNVYNIGDRVFWNGKVYQCLIATIPIDHEEALNDLTYSGIRSLNIFPDDPVNGLTYWGAGVSYSESGLIPNQPASAAWSSVTTYSAGQFVTYNGVTWESLINANLNKTPGGDITSWQSVTWVKGDNRNPQLVRYMVYMVIWYLSPTLSPVNVPKYWESNYNMAIDWLKMAAAGDITPNVPEKQPPQGNRIRFGGNVKQINNY